MNVNDIIKIMDKLDHSSIQELSIHDDKFQLCISKRNHPEPVIQTHGADTYTYESETNKISEDTVIPMPTVTDDETGKVINSPLVGIYYESSSPESDPYIKVGDKVNEGDVVCVIEAMKVFNEIKSPHSGVVKKILVSNQDIVEFDQPLIIIGDNE